MSGFNKDLKRGEMFFIQKSSDYVECGSEIYSGRPAIIVSNQNLNAVSKTVEVVYLTTKEKYDSHLHVKIQSIKSSVAICEQITTVAKERIGDYYGKVVEGKFERSLEHGKKILHCLRKQPERPTNDETLPRCKDHRNRNT